MFYFHDRPCRASIDAERFRLLVERGIPRRDQRVCDVLNSDGTAAVACTAGDPVFSRLMVGSDPGHYSYHDTAVETDSQAGADRETVFILVCDFFVARAARDPSKAVTMFQPRNHLQPANKRRSSAIRATIATQLVQ